MRQPVEAGEPVCLGGRKSSPEGGTRDGATGGKDQHRSPCARRLLPSLHVGLWGHSLSRTSFPKKQPAEAWGRGPDRVCHTSRVVKTALRRRALVRPARAGASPGSAPCGRGGAGVCSEPHSSSRNHAAGLASRRFPGRRGRVFLRGGRARGRRRTGVRCVSGPGKALGRLPGHGLPGEPTEQQGESLEGTHPLPPGDWPCDWPRQRWGS